MRFLLLALLLAGLATGCREAPGRDSGDRGRPALWVIEDVQGRPAGWLFGTIHALPAEAQWESPALDDALSGAGVLIVEVTDLDQDRISATLSRIAADEPTAPLRKRLRPGAARHVLAAFARDGADLAQYDRLETWAIALALARAPNSAASTTRGVDRALLTRFAGRPVGELEGAERQLAVFDDLGEAEQQAMLAAVLAERDDPATRTGSLPEAWLKGDMAAIEQATRTGLLSEPALYEALLARRNAAWIVSIARLVDRGRRPLVAVGAAHMVGPDGLPALLEARGYRVRRIQ